MIDFALLERLLDLLHRSDAQTIEIRRWTTTIRVSKGPLGNSGPPVTYQVSAPAPAAPPPAAAATSPAPAAAAAAAASTLTEIKSPMVGTFSAQPEPGAEPYVRVGGRVSPGQTLCIIEAMKIMNPLDSEVSGVIREVLVEDAQPVEFGQILFRVDPNG
ncbi:MAG TPA: acetyl-CoA carboxylase biotin carboxyl carrier protein [Anaeromyxobacteraceae bacterium]|nr:acetyl-CoA carboxylase biotin carboxyl carrier protein [Anaeromyxobacteraceae bacterium]